MRWLVGLNPLPGWKTLFSTLTQAVLAALLFTATTLILVFVAKRLVVIDIVIIYYALAILTTHAGRTTEAVIIALVAPFAVRYFIFADVPRVPLDKAEMAIRAGAAAALGYFGISAAVQWDFARQALRTANAVLESRVAERTAGAA